MANLHLNLADDGQHFTEQLHLEVQESMAIEEQVVGRPRRFIHVKRLARMRHARSGVRPNWMDGGCLQVCWMFWLMPGRRASCCPTPHNDFSCLELPWDWPPTCNPYSEESCYFSAAGSSFPVRS